MDTNETQPTPPSVSQPTIVSTPAHTPVWLIVLLLLLFWPAAFYLMYKDKRFHTWFPVLLWIYAIPFLLLSLVYAFFVIPQLNALLVSVNAVHPSLTIIYVIIALVDVVLIIEIIFAFYAKKQIREDTIHANKALLITITLLILNITICYLYSVFLSLSVITPIYSLMSAVGDDTHGLSPAESKSTATAPSSALQNIDTTNWQTYTSPCITFKYPSNYLKNMDTIMTDHKIVKGKDIYGTTGVDFVFDAQAHTKGTIRVSCMPNFANLDNSAYLKQWQDSFNSNTKNNTSGDNYQFMTISGKSAIRVIYNAYTSSIDGRIGTDDIYTSDENYIYQIEMAWPTTADNIPNLPDRLNYNILLQSVVFIQPTITP